MTTFQGAHRDPKVKRIFLSSTYIDLREHRKVARDTIERMGQLPVVMEQFGAKGEGDPTSVSLDLLTSAHAYFAIIAWRYGYIPLGESESITCLEYRKAVELGRPCFIFLSDPDTEEPAGVGEQLFPAILRDVLNAAKLRSFRNELQTKHSVATFSTPDDLARKIAVALNEFLLSEQRQELINIERVPRILPPRPHHFVGRQSEIERITSLMTIGKSIGVVAAINGMAGIGKSALAAEVMHRLADDPHRFSAGMTYISCEDRNLLQGLAWIYERILSHWGIAPSLDIEMSDSMDQLVDKLEMTVTARLQFKSSGASDAAALILLDNIEPGLAIDRIVRLLASVHVAVIATMRHGISSTMLHLEQLTSLDSSSSAEMFWSVYNRHALERINESAMQDAGEDVAEIVELLGFLPLAVELAAARAALIYRTPVALLEELRDSNKVDALHDPLDGTRSIRYMFEKSLTVLAEDGRLRFAALGALDGLEWPHPLVVRFLAAVTDSATKRRNVDADVKSASADLERFSALSLIKTYAMAPGGTRLPSAEERAVKPLQMISIHPLMHEFARAIWLRYPVDQQHLGSEARILVVCEWIVESRNDFSLLAREERMIRGMLSLDYSNLQLRKAEIAQVSAIMALETFFEIGGHRHLGLQLMENCAKICDRLNDKAGQSRALRCLGRLTADLGKADSEAERYFKQALKVAEKAGNKEARQQSHLNLGVFLSRGSSERKSAALASLNKAYKLAESLHNAQAQCEAMREIGLHLVRHEDIGSAIQMLSRALSISQQVGDNSGKARALLALGIAEYRRGEGDKAARLLKEALLVGQLSSDLETQMHSLYHLCLNASKSGEEASASAYFTQGLTLARTLGDRRCEYFLLTSLARLSSTFEEKQAAKTYLLEALRIARELGDRANELDTLVALGRLSLMLYDRIPARTFFEAAGKLAQELNNVQLELECGLALAQILEKEEGPEVVIAAYTILLKKARRLREPSVELELLNALGRLEYERQQLDQAHELYSAALELASTVRNVHAIAQNHLALGEVAYARKDHPKARSAFSMALKLAQETQDRACERDSLDGLASVESQLRNKQQQKRYLEQALSIARELGDVECERLIALGTLSNDLRQVSQSIAYFQEALPLAIALGARKQIADIYLQMGDLAQMQRNLDSARDYYAKARAQFEITSDRPSLINVLNRLRDLEMRVGNKAQARRLDELASGVQRTLSALARRSKIWGTDASSSITGISSSDLAMLTLGTGDKLGEAETLNKLGLTSLRYGYRSQAAQQFRRSLQIYRDANDMIGEAVVLTNLGVLELGLHRLEVAEYCFTIAQHNYHKLGNVLEEANVTRYLGDIASDQAYLDEARKFYDHALYLYHQIRYIEGVERVQLKLKRIDDKVKVKARYTDPEAHVLIIEGRQIKPWRRPK